MQDTFKEELIIATKPKESVSKAKSAHLKREM
jgi:hypothetical protein